MIFDLIVCSPSVPILVLILVIWYFGINTGAPSFRSTSFARKYCPYANGEDPYCSRFKYDNKLTAFSGLFSSIGVFAFERIINIKNDIYPIRRNVNARMDVLSLWYSCFLEMCKEVIKKTTILIKKNIVPELNGSDN